MKIIVDGNLIDTEYIYNITEVGNAQYNTTVNNYNDKAVYAGNGITIHLLFRINFLNKKHIDIQTHKHYDILKSGDEPYEWYKVEYDIEYNIINTLRDKVLRVWLKNQNEIPKFEL